MADDKYKDLLKKMAGNAIKRATDAGDSVEEIKDDEYKSTEEAASYAAEATQAVGKAKSGGDKLLIEILTRYEGYKSGINGRSFYRHQMSRASKIPAALNHLDAVKATDGIADIIFKEKLK